MINALWTGRKTETRRIFKDAPDDAVSFWCDAEGDGFWRSRNEKGEGRALGHFGTRRQVGDLIWVKETWRPLSGYSNWDFRIKFAADDVEVHFEDGDYDSDWNWPKAAKTGNVSPLYLPKWASRITLRVTGYRIERLHEIDHSGAIAEGVEMESADPPFYYVPGAGLTRNTAVGVEEPGDIDHSVRSYAKLWDYINGVGAWDTNPWVEVIQFEVIKQNILHVTGEHPMKTGNT